MNRQEYKTLRKSKPFQHVIRAEKMEHDIYEMLPYFKDALLIGDSMAESILDYRLLRKYHVLAKRGGCIDGIDADLERAFILKPNYLFLEFGKNDIRHFQKTIPSFIQCYAEKIEKIQKALPDTRIFINSIIPMKSSILDQLGGTMLLDAFNHALACMCRIYQLTYIDNSELIAFHDDDFEFDGIHPKYPYYVKWLKHMAAKAGLYPDTKEQGYHPDMEEFYINE